MSDLTFREIDRLKFLGGKAREHYEGHRATDCEMCDLWRELMAREEAGDLPAAFEVIFESDAGSIVRQHPA